MKWRRGLFRMWVVLSVCWIVAVGAIAWSGMPRNYQGDEEHPTGRSFIDRIVREHEREQDIKLGVAIAFVPPIIVLALGAATAWAIKGFR
jgi:hypothetical protein